MCGSGTTLDVARDLGRRALGYDIAPYRDDIFRVDARKLPLEDAKADFVFIDPPYSTHLEYSDDPACIGKLDAHESAYYEAMEQVIREIYRVLRPQRYMALYVSDSYQKQKPFAPIGFRLFSILDRLFLPVDIVAVVRHNRTLKRHHYHTEAVKGNYFLRGFNYLFIMKKDAAKRPPPPRRKPAAKSRPRPASARTVPRERRNNAEEPSADHPGEHAVRRPLPASGKRAPQVRGTAGSRTPADRAGDRSTGRPHPGKRGGRPAGRGGKPGGTRPPRPGDKKRRG
jgi:SAM-dependent methyltransferase